MIKKHYTELEGIDTKLRLKWFKDAPYISWSDWLLSEYNVTYDIHINTYFFDYDIEYHQFLLMES